MHPHSRGILAGVALIIVGSAVIGSLLARGPDFSLSFTREVQSSQSPEELTKAWEQIDQWPSWHFNAIRAERMVAPTEAALPAQLQAGSTVRLFLEPPKKEWKRFQMDLRVTEYVPGKRIRIALEEESKGRLKKLLSGIQWTIELLPRESGQGTLIRGTVEARTASGRARLLARMADRVIMNQILYPDLEALAFPEKRKGLTGEQHDGRLLPF